MWLEESLFYVTVAFLMTRVVNVLIEDEMFEERTEQAQLDKKDKQYAYIDGEGNQMAASPYPIMAEDDVS